MKKVNHPESHMMTYGYKPELSEGAIKPPIFQTSTFVFKNAEEGKAYFELAYGLREKEQSEELGLIYSRINNPNLEILEDRLCLWDQALSLSLAWQPTWLGRRIAQVRRPSCARHRARH